MGSKGLTISNKTDTNSQLGCLISLNGIYKNRSRDDKSDIVWLRDPS